MKDLPKNFVDIERAMVKKVGVQSWKQKLPSIVHTVVQAKKGRNSYMYDDTLLDLFRLIRNHSHHKKDVNFSDDFKNLYENSVPEA